MPISRRPGAADVGTALLALAFLGLPTVAMAITGRPLATVTALVAAVLMPLLLVWRRTHPALSAASIYLLALLHWAAALGDAAGPALFAGTTPAVLPVDLVVLAALYSVTIHGAPPARRAGVGGAVVGAVLAGTSIALASQSLGLGVTTVLAGVALVVAVWATGTQRRGRLRAVEVLRERNRALEAERDQQVKLATVSERTRIAREMHDIVAHSLSVVIAQADGGRYAAAQDPTAAVRALETIADLGRGALADMRSIIGVLREDGDHEDAPHRPQPIDTDLQELTERVRDSGLPVSLVRVGTPRPLPPGMGLAVHRICQEALTNALKYAGPKAEATVQVRWLPSALEIQVDDDGRGAAANELSGQGHGVIGMRERAAVFGGTLEAGPRPGGGFRVRATLPAPASGAAVPAPAPRTDARPRTVQAATAPAATRDLPRQGVPDVPVTARTAPDPAPPAHSTEPLTPWPLPDRRGAPR